MAITFNALGSNTGATGSTSLASPSVSPSSNALLVAAYRTRFAVASFTVSTTLSNVGTWTVVNDATNLCIIYAKVTGAPGTGTVTVTHANQSDRHIHLGEFLGYDTSNPVPQFKVGSASTSGTTYTASFASTPASTSAVFAALHANGMTSAAATPGAAFTEVFDTATTTTRIMETEYDIGSPAISFDWSGLTDTVSRFGIAIEIQEPVVTSPDSGYLLLGV